MKGNVSGESTNKPWIRKQCEDPLDTDIQLASPFQTTASQGLFAILKRVDGNGKHKHWTGLTSLTDDF